MATFTQQDLRPASDGVHGTLLLPERARSKAALLIGGSGGQEPTYVAELLAAEGITALSVATFGRPALPARLDHIELGYFRRALQVLRHHGAGTTVVIGQSRGSEAALLCGVHFPELVDAVVASVPSNVSLCGYPEGGPCWLLDGEPLPWTEGFGPECSDSDAIIAVERIPGPVMLVAAGSDQIWPSAPMARAVADRLVAHGDPYGHVLLEYPGARHSLGYLRPDLPASVLGDLDDDPATRAARADAWPRVLRFVLTAG